MHRFKVNLTAALSVVVCLGLICAVNAAEPSLHLEGKGTFSFFAPCSSTSCPAVLTATLDGVPFGQAAFDMPISISPVANEFTGCRPAFSRGGKLNQGQHLFTFSGEFCEHVIKGLSYIPGHSPPPPTPSTTPPPRFQGYSLSGTIQIHAAGVLCSGQDLPAAVGTLTVYGDTYGDQSVVSIIGTANSIPLCPAPSP